MIRLLIVDDVESTREHLRKLLGFETDIEVCGTADNGQAAVDAAQKLNPDVVLMDINMPVMDGIQATEKLAQILPATPVIIMSVQGERDYLRRAMQAGAREFLIKPFSYDELVAAVRRVHQLEQKKTGLVRESDLGRPDGTVRKERNRGRVIVTVGGKGGVGTSIVALNLAGGLRKMTGESVILVDLDLQFGDIGIMLNRDHSRSFTDLINQNEPGKLVDDDVLEEMLLEGPEGIRLLLSPPTPELADLVQIDHLRTLLARLKERFDYVLFDTACHLGELSLEVVEAADYIVLVTGASIPSLKDTKLMLNVLGSLHVPDTSIVLVLNHTDTTTGITKELTEKNLQFTVAADIPYDPRAIGDSIFKASPVVLSQEDTDISRAYMRLVEYVLPADLRSVVATPAAAGQQDKKKQRKLFGK
ncbi:MAG: response regulator [Candidatus Dormibacteria bacterium]